MALAALTAFPASFVAGDTLRVTISDATYPSSTYSLAVVLRGAGVKSFAATASGTQFSLVVSAADTARLAPGRYMVTFVYTETGSNERVSVMMGSVEVMTDPTKQAEKSVARQTLEAMQDALLKLSNGSNMSVSFNGHSFTKKNLKELQDAIDRQRAIVDREEAISTSTKRYSGLFVRFGRPNYCAADGLNQ